MTSPPRSPGAPAATVGSVTLSRSEVAARTNQLARWCHSQGAQTDTTVAVVLPNGFALVEAVIAIWKTGATPLVLPAKMPDAESKPSWPWRIARS